MCRRDLVHSQQENGGVGGFLTTSFSSPPTILPPNDIPRVKGMGLYGYGFLPLSDEFAPFGKSGPHFPPPPNSILIA